MAGKQKGLQRINTYTISEVFDYMDAAPKSGIQVNFHGFMLSFRSTRMRNFRTNGIKCTNCNIQGAFFALERYRKVTPHLNLYGFNRKGENILMTRDHIRPKSKGGPNNLYNAQTMCVDCNCRKDSGWSFKAKMKYYMNKARYFMGR